MYLRQIDIMKEARITDIDFNQTARMNDSGVIKLWQLMCQSSKKSPMPAGIKVNKYSVTRTSDSVTVHFWWVGKDQSAKETFRVVFVPVQFRSV